MEKFRSVGLKPIKLTQSIHNIKKRTVFDFKDLDEKFLLPDEVIEKYNELQKDSLKRSLKIYENNPSEFRPLDFTLWFEYTQKVKKLSDEDLKKEYFSIFSDSSKNLKLSILEKEINLRKLFFLPVVQINKDYGEIFNQGSDDINLLDLVNQNKDIYLDFTVIEELEEHKRLELEGLVLKMIDKDKKIHILRSKLYFNSQDDEAAAILSKANVVVSLPPVEKVIKIEDNNNLPSLEEFKKMAKVLKNKNKISKLGHSQNLLAQKYGYKDYNSIRPYLKSEE